ncbi:hypothetical protein Pmani_020389 [Petrolisthes manimaculis]|uniref:Uncharacterized protein n=1 Tax=Petrolisthes manimaculis TaxID=1843537 RepID=A0AAE1U4H0_9EUCA|nr:hypothetical protein Pmani_020389 [Petrolisthes manimaculis]
MIPVFYPGVETPGIPAETDAEQVCELRGAREAAVGTVRHARGVRQACEDPRAAFRESQRVYVRVTTRYVRQSALGAVRDSTNVYVRVSVLGTFCYSYGVGDARESALGLLRDPQCLYVCRVGPGGL